MTAVAPPAEGRCISSACGDLRLVRCDALLGSINKLQNAIGAPIEPGEFITQAFPREIGDGVMTLGSVADGIYVSTADVTLAQPFLGVLQGNGLLRFRVWLCHRQGMWLPGERERIFGPHSSICILPEGSQQYMKLDAGKRIRYASVLCDPVKLAKQVNIGSYLSSSTPSHGDSPFIRYMPIEAGVDAAATDLVSRPYSGRNRDALSFARTLELIVRLVSTPRERQRHMPAACPLTASEIDRLNTVRETLQNSISAAPTIDQLARMVGLGRGKLIAGFRCLFGESTSDFLRRKRMEKALELLRSRALPISQVAECVGYRHQSTFTTAFQHYFGHSPGAMRI